MSDDLPQRVELSAGMKRRLVEELAWRANMSGYSEAVMYMWREYGIDRETFADLVMTPEFQEKLKKYEYVYQYVPWHRRQTQSVLNRAASGSDKATELVARRYRGEDGSAVELTQTLRIEGGGDSIESKLAKALGMVRDEQVSAGGDGGPREADVLDDVVEVRPSPELRVGAGPEGSGGGDDLGSRAGTRSGAEFPVHVPTPPQAALVSRGAESDEAVHREQPVGEDDGGVERDSGMVPWVLAEPGDADPQAGRDDGGATDPGDRGRGGLHEPSRGGDDPEATGPSPVGLLGGGDGQDPGSGSEQDSLPQRLDDQADVL